MAEISSWDIDCMTCKAPNIYYVHWLLSCVWLFATPRTVARQAPLSMELSRQGYWSGLPFPSPGGLPNPGVKPSIGGTVFTIWAIREAPIYLLSGPLLKSLSIFVLTWQNAVTIRQVAASHWKLPTSKNQTLEAETRLRCLRILAMRTTRGLLRTCQTITFPFPAQQVWVWGKWAKFGQLECTTRK